MNQIKTGRAARSLKAEIVPISLPPIDREDSDLKMALGLALELLTDHAFVAFKQRLAEARIADAAAENDEIGIVVEFSQRGAA